MEENVVVRRIHQAIMSTPHGSLGVLVQTMSQAIAEHPLLGAKACVFTFAHSKIRDQQQAAIIALVQAGLRPGKEPDQLGIREAGLALMGLDIYKTGNTDNLEAMHPFMIFGIWDYLRGYEFVRQTYRFEGKQRFRRIRQKQRRPATQARRAMGKFMHTYLRLLEKNAKRFDNLVTQPHMRAYLKAAYTHHRIQPGPRAKAILFDRQPPPDSVDALIKEIKALPEGERARRVLESSDRLSFITAASLLPKGDAKTMIALVELMTPNQARNSVAMVEDSGILEIKEVADVFWGKVKEADSLAALSTRRSSQAKTEAGQAAIAEAKEKVLAQEEKIGTPTLLLLDYSSSMHISHDVAIEFGTLLAPRFTNLHTVLFWDSATHVSPKDNTIDGWKRALAGHRVSGRTSIGGGLQYALRKGWPVEQTVIVTDGGENCYPLYINELEHLPDIRTNVIAVRSTANSYNRAWSDQIEQAGYPIEVFEYQNDPLIFDNLGLALAGKGHLSLAQMILETELPYIIK